ncbi:hypothetical protein EDB19DRAFT_1246298 [Suillus lakei]|nr:hypothetical protein EDB19DRAFT_1246298 [Suillus lakei]
MTPLSILDVWNAVFNFPIPSLIVCIGSDLTFDTRQPRLDSTLDYDKRIPKRYILFTCVNWTPPDPDPPSYLSVFSLLIPQAGHYIIPIANQPTTYTIQSPSSKLPRIRPTLSTSIIQAKVGSCGHSGPRSFEKTCTVTQITHHAERHAKLSLFVSRSCVILYMASFNPCSSLPGLYICPRGSASSDLFGHR